MYLKVFLGCFVFVYTLISLPAILGIGNVIEWVPEATLFQKFKVYVVDGLGNNFIVKSVIASMVAVVVTLVMPKKRK